MFSFPFLYKKIIVTYVAVAYGSRHGAIRRRYFSLHFNSRAIPPFSFGGRSVTFPKLFYPLPFLCFPTTHHFLPPFHSCSTPCHHRDIQSFSTTSPCNSFATCTGPSPVTAVLCVSSAIRFYSITKQIKAVPLLTLALPQLNFSVVFLYSASHINAGTQLRYSQAIHIGSSAFVRSHSFPGTIRSYS
jgi:hypothetical protein